MCGTSEATRRNVEQRDSGTDAQCETGEECAAFVACSTCQLFVVPAFYALLAPFTRSPEALAQELERLEAETPSVGGHA